MSLFNRLVLNSPDRVKLSYRTASPPKTSFSTASPPRTSCVTGSVFSRLILPPARPESVALANSTVPSSLFNGVELSSGWAASGAGPPASQRSELTEMNPVVPAIKSSSSVDGSVKKKTKQMDITAAEAEALIPFYLEGTVRESTKKQYRSYFIRYKNYCHENSLNIHSPKSISMFLIALSETSKGKSAAFLAKHAIRYNLKLLAPFKKSPTDNFYIKQILKSIHKQFARPVKKATCLDSVMILNLVQSLMSEKNFKADRAAVFFLLQFTICGRFEEVAKLKLCNLTFLPSGHLEVKVEQAKNFENWDSQCSYVAKNTEGNFDPLAVITPYFNFLSQNNSKWLFPNFRLTKAKKIKILDVHVSFSHMLSTTTVKFNQNRTRGEILLFA